MRYAPPLIVLLAFAPSSAQSLLRSVPGPGLNAHFGTACISVPDQNGDGYADLLVGAPGYNQERGAIFCVSGSFLATGLGTATVWSLAPAVNQGDRFGASLAFVDDPTGDGVGDFLVGIPGFDVVGAPDVGGARLVSGATRLIVSSFQYVNPLQGGSQLGSSMVVAGDRTGDGVPEVAIGAPGDLGTFSGVTLLNPRAGTSPTGPIMNSIWNSLFSAPSQAGAALASGFDHDSNGRTDILVGMPGANGAGWILVLDGDSGLSLDDYAGLANGERFGASLDAAHDYDGDGVIDFVVGAPGALGANGAVVGRAVVLSGQRMRDDTPPFEIYSLSPIAPGAMPTTLRFGTAVCASEDLNGDGVGDFLVGAPDFSTTVPIGPGKGSVTLYSGATGQRLTSIVGANQDRLGDSILGAIADLDGDSFPEFVVAGSRSDVVATDNGVLKAYRLFPVTPSTYCTGKPNSLGCTPSIGFTGSPSASAPSGFVISASNVLNQRNGLLFYSYAPQSTAFQGGFLCVAPPSVRTPIQGSGGASTGSSCSGAFGIDFNAWIASGIDGGLVAGAEVYGQYWARDPQSPSKTSLSNALRLLVNP